MGSAEAKVEKYLVEQVKRLGGEALKVTYQGRAGAPDRWCFIPGGILIIVETKAKGGRLSALQKKHLAWFTKMGFSAHCVYSREQVDEILGLNDGVDEHDWEEVRSKS